MTHMQEVPTDDLLSFQDYPTVHSPSNNTTSGFSSGSTLTSNYPSEIVTKFDKNAGGDVPGGLDDESAGTNLLQQFYNLYNLENGI